MGDGEEVVVADVGVALKVSLVVAPDPLSSHDEDVFLHSIFSSQLGLAWTWKKP